MQKVMIVISYTGLSLITSKQVLTSNFSVKVSAGGRWENNRNLIEN